MTRSFDVSIVALAVLSLAQLCVDGQTKTKTQTSSKDWTPSLTSDGQPDLQGNWMNKSATPLERPKQLEGRQFLTDAEVVELKNRAERLFKSGNNDFPQGLQRDDVFNAVLANVDHYKNPNSTGGTDQMIPVEFDNRTSLIVDPPDGKLPAYTAAGQRRQSTYSAAVGMLTPAASTKDLTNFQRCLTWDIPLPRPGPYTSYYQIVQSPGYVVILMEAIHDARIIPLDGRPHLPPNIRALNGDSVGRWEGNTLVIDTTNFSPQSYFLGSAENRHLIERFTRVAPDEIRYEFTVDDPTTWAKPWTAVLRLKHTPDKIYEFACHEGNFDVMKGMLLGARAQEKQVKVPVDR